MLSAAGAATCGRGQEKQEAVGLADPVGAELGRLAGDGL